VGKAILKSQWEKSQKHDSRKRKGTDSERQEERTGVSWQGRNVKRKGSLLQPDPPSPHRKKTVLAKKGVQTPRGERIKRKQGKKGEAGEMTVSKTRRREV